MQPKFARLLISDFDGTLRHNTQGVSPRTREALAELRHEGVCVAVATGRHLQSAMDGMDAEFPIDYLVFSSGCGVMDWREKKLLRKASFADHERALLLRAAEEMGVSFIVHAETPDNHRFAFSGREPHPSDFLALIARTRERSAHHLAEWEAAMAWTISQSVWFLHEFTEAALEAIRAKLHPLEVVRTTSPLDHRSQWIEIFPAGVSKAAGSDWLRERLGIPHRETFALGNDYNDLPLLRWAASARVVENAPESMRAEFGSVPAVDRDGAVHAIETWFRKAEKRAAR